MAEPYPVESLDKAVAAGNTPEVKKELFADYLKLGPAQFTDIVNKMANNQDHPLSVERDKNGEVTAINMTNLQALGVSLWSTKVFDKTDGAPQHNPFDFVGEITRTIPGALDTKK